MVVNGYTLLFHPALVAQLERLLLGVTRDGARESKSGTQSKGTAATSNAKVLAHLYFAMLGEIPFRQDLRLIVYGWVNDSETLRSYGSTTDASRRLGQMLDAGTPPDDWPTLLAQAQAPESSARTRGALASAKKLIK